jgi:hypothetical protein
MEVVMKKPTKPVSSDKPAGNAWRDDLEQRLIAAIEEFDRKNQDNTWDDLADTFEGRENSYVNLTHEDFDAEYDLRIHQGTF